jgi:hypothetical protein
MRINRPGADSLDIIVVGSQGRSDTFTWNPDGSGTYLARPDLPVLSLVHRSTGEYVASEEDGSVWTFDGQGRLTEVAEPSKPTLTVVQGQYVRSAWRSFPATPLTDFVEA